MMYTDDSKGVRVAKDPAVVRFRDIYYMYYSVCERLDDGTMKWGIGIARSSDMESWEKIV